jgi:hypothetical protein
MMGITELEITNKMLRCRKAMQSLWGEEYQDKVKFWKDVVVNHGKQTGMDTLKSVIDLSKKVDEEPSAVIWLMSAALDLIEQPPLQTNKAK